MRDNAGRSALALAGLGTIVPDCPVQPYVWRTFAERGGLAPLDLIAQVRRGDAAPMIANILRQSFKGGSIFAHGSYLLVRASFREMFTGLLPLTSWNAFVELGAKLSLMQLRHEIEVVRDGIRPTMATEKGAQWGAEDLARLRFIIAVVDQLGDEGDAKPESRLRGLFQAAAATADAAEATPIVSVGLDREALPSVSMSRVTVKADAAELLFDINCEPLTWAVVDTGVDAEHPGFLARSPDVGSRVIASYDIPAGVRAIREKAGAEAMYAGLLDDDDWTDFVSYARTPRRLPRSEGENSHGTHVAGVLGADSRVGPGRRRGKATVGGEVIGMCPTLRLVDIRVFSEDLQGREFDVIVALAFVRWLNDRLPLGPDRRIDGVNISLSIPFAVDNFACGWTPVCQEVNRLVNSGVVVVAAAGNSGYDELEGLTSVGAGFRMVSISDPGNAEAAITVGATHNLEPHRYGPTARSARGPTADGRHKPDLLAPGVDIRAPVPRRRWDTMSGTSQAAAHVSGAAAMLMARFPELRGDPVRVKRILCETATDLGRLPDFQGYGLLDALRALQAP